MSVTESSEPEHSKEPSQEPSKDSSLIVKLQIESLTDALTAYIEQNGLSDDVSISCTADTLTAVLDSDVLFPSGSAVLYDEVWQFAADMTGVLSDARDGGLSFSIEVSAHTDNTPISTAQFPSNKDLSLARALAFVEVMTAGTRLDPSIFSAVGRGDLYPVASNDTSEGRAQNRRVEILLIAILP